MSLHLSEADAARLLKGLPPKRSKYGAERVTHDGYTFDSKRERNWYLALKLRQKAGEIAALRLQTSWDLHVCGVRVARYVSDFDWIETANGELVVADPKGVRTRIYRLKARMFEAEYGIRITEL